MTDLIKAVELSIELWSKKLESTKWYLNRTWKHGISEKAPDIEIERVISEYGYHDKIEKYQSIIENLQAVKEKILSIKVVGGTEIIVKKEQQQ